MSPNASREKEIFLEAAERPEAERGRFVGAACAGDAELEGRILRLLRAHSAAERLMPAGPLPPAALGLGPAVDVELSAGERVGPYRLIEELGQGGFGVVWLAHQEEPVKRPVAIKVLKVGMDTRDVVTRFEAERQALALMDHPCIAKVFEAGATPRGRPYFAMELVAGLPITQYCEERRLGARARIELFLAVCRGVQHAHQKGVIHRDLKPSNVMVTEVDGRAQPKIIDFGIAKATGARLTEKTLATRDGQLIGTPAYMSPEQVDESLDIDTRADVYSLGVLLYELLSGSTPFETTDLRPAGLMELRRVIREVDPPRPSARVAGSAGTGRRRSTTVLGRDLRGDLDWIVMRCLEKDRERRYDSAAVLANDLERHLRGEPVLAGPPDLAYRLRKLGRRYRGPILAALALFVVLTAGLLVSVDQARRARRAERLAGDETARAQIELARFEAVADFLQEVLMSIDPAVAQGKDRELLLDVLDRASKRIETLDKDQPVVEATLRRTLGGTYFTLARFDEAEAQLRRALALQEQALGPDDEETLETVEYLGGVLLRRGDNDGARALLERALQGFRAHHGPEHDLTLGVRGNLALLAAREGRADEAEQELRELLAIRTRLYGEEHDDTILSMNNLGMLLENRNRTSEALELYERALELNMDLHGELYPNTLATMGNVGMLYSQLGRYEEAQAFLDLTLELKRILFAPDHPSIVLSLNNLASHYKQRAQYEQAEECFQEALELESRRGDELDESKLILLYNLADLRLRSDRHEEAEPELVRALPACLETLGEGHALTRAVRMALAACLARIERSDEAAELARHERENPGEAYPQGEPELGVYRIRRGLMLAALGRVDEAEEDLTEGHRLIADGENDWSRQAAGALAELHARAGRDVEADRWRALAE